MTTINTKIKSGSKAALKKKSPSDKVTSEFSKHLHEHFGFDGFKYPQEEIIKSLLDGNG